MARDIRAMLCAVGIRYRQASILSMLHNSVFRAEPARSNNVCVAQPKR
jgi:hypothetical protein